MIKSQIVTFLASLEFKRILFLVGIVFLIATAFISVNPEPFLRFGYWGVFVFSLFGPGMFLIPSLVDHLGVIPLALVVALGYALNDSISWFIGSTGHTIIPHGKRFERVEATLHTYGQPALFFWALIPFPYDAIALISGYLGFSYWRFVWPTFLGRLVRFIALGYGLVKFF